MEEIEITRIEGEDSVVKQDVVAREVPFTINLNGSEFVILLSSPSDLKELSTGFLFSSGLLRSAEEIENITVDEEKWLAEVTLKNKELSSELVFKRMYTSGCGGGTLFYHALDLLHRRKNTSSFTIERNRIFDLMSEFNRTSIVFKKTGGVHYAALSDGVKIIGMKEDIGRHNAVDKIIGWTILQGISFENKMFLTSGRLSSEIILKVQKTGAPVILSRSAPTNQGVRLAREMNLTLIGFIRGKKMNIYSAGERVVS
jgi:FdhD protein